MLSLKELLKIETIEVINKPSKDISSLSFYTDTRQFNKELVFIAIEGENFKPLSFIENIQASIIVCEDNEFNRKQISDNDKTFILVSSSINSLREITSSLSKKFQENGGKVIAISGSNGKTTTKEMLFHVLGSVSKNVVCTQKNNNNHIGVPLTLFQINENTEFCIVELGSNHPGEIKYLVDMIDPSFGVCTNIGETHLEFFDSVENVFKEEGYLLKFLSEKQKPLFVNCDDDFLIEYKSIKTSINYGIDEDNHYVFHFDTDSFKYTKAKAESVFVNENVTGRHNKLNLLLAAAISDYLEFDMKKIIKAVSSFRPTSNRSQWLEMNNRKVFLDAYNANPSSMRAAIMAFKEKCLEQGLKKEELAIILGDMNELGKDAVIYHEELGKFCVQSGLANLYFVGDYAHSYNKGCNYIGTEFLTTEQLKKKITDIATLHKAIFIKGSRSLQLESTVDITLC